MGEADPILDGGQKAEFRRQARQATSLMAVEGLCSHLRQAMDPPAWVLYFFVYQFGPVAGAGFPENVFQVELDGVGRNTQSLGDLLVGKVFRQQFQHPPFGQ